MDSPKIVYKYYSNPAFCAQSEVVFSQTTPCVTSKIQTPDRQRIPPIGASPRKLEASPRFISRTPQERSNRIIRTDISDNPLRMHERDYDEPPKLPPKPARFSHRNGNNYRSMIVKPSAKSSARARTRSEDLEMAQFQQQRRVRYDRNANSDDDGLEDKYTKHRYEVIRDDIDDLVDYSPTKKRIIEADADDISEYNVDAPDDKELKEIPTEIVKTVNGKTLRYAIVSTEEDEEEPRKMNITFTSPKMSQKNLIATQKLHELLSTPRKLKSYGSQPSVRITPNKQESPRYVLTPTKIMSSTPTHGITPSKSCANLSRSLHSPISPKAQQKLNYGLEDRHDVFVTSFREKSRDRSLEEKRDRRYEGRGKESFRKEKSTAVIVPRLATPQSAYSEDTVYKSWSSLKNVSAATASLAIAALMMTLCGGLTAGLSFYIMYSMGRRYYLDFGVLAGFTCLLLGLLGFRSRRNQLLPNRNYISGYIVLSTFSIFSAAGLLMILTLEPKPGLPLHDMTSGAVCGLSILSLAVASIGVVTSLCCKQPPPDNRVATTTRWY